MNDIVYTLIPIGIYYVFGLVFYVTKTCIGKRRHEGYTYINNTTRLEEL